MEISRRRFNQGLLALAFTGLSRQVTGASLFNHDISKVIKNEYGDLIEDPAGVLDLPKGFSYEIISALDDVMADGLPVPDRADGMGCFQVDEDRVVLVRNHEIHAGSDALIYPTEPMTELAYDQYPNKAALPGGTSNILYNLKNQKVEHQFMSLTGTVRNCAGGTTPWNTWLTCEESVDKPSAHNSKEHGYVFEVPADAKEMVEAIPLKAMGRFNHEAACVDPRTGIVYLTEDRNDSLFYRFIPNTPEKLIDGGTLQAMVIKSKAKFDTRNWSSNSMMVNEEYDVTWVTLDDVESPNDDLRVRGHQQGAALFARGEGIYWGDNELYFTCTSGGEKKLGQVMRYVPSLDEGSTKENTNPGKISLFFESPNEQTFNYGDNIAVAPNGHLIVCEDQYLDVVNNKLKGIRPDGSVYDLAKVRWQTEPAGVCFSPDGKTMFLNLYSPTATLAITGPWSS